MDNDQVTQLSVSTDGQTLLCAGTWTITDIDSLETHYADIVKKADALQLIDASQIKRFDTAGALLLYNIEALAAKRNKQLKVQGLNNDFSSLLQLVSTEFHKKKKPIAKKIRHNIFFRIGRASIEKFNQLFKFIKFIGEFTVTVLYVLTNLRRFYWRGISQSLNESGLQALPILALMAFLIGIVLAYQIGIQLEIYGANIFIVDFSGIAILREFAPLITAVIMAGRTSTSFAALIGTMMVNEEIDALRTLGVSPVERLVIPRVIGLVLSLPLLIIWADFFGVFGSMIMAKYQLGISYVAYLERFSSAVGMKNYILGLIKGPFFAVLIASIGCFQGFQVELSADSVGQKTTRAAVQALFLIIIADAVFSIVFSRLGY